MKKIVIVGAGITGLAFAYECLLRKHQVLIVEKTFEVGGLARTVTHNDCLLDIGVHLLYLKDPEVRKKVEELISPEEWLRVKRNGKLYLKSRYIDWPPTLRSPFQFPFSFSFRVLLDQILKTRSDGVVGNYESEILSIYGPTLYHSFFEPLTKKFLKVDPKSVHSDWAFSSLRSATKIEDKSFAQSYKYLTQTTDANAKNDFNIFKFLLQSLKTNREKEHFYYFSDGFGVLAEAYKKKILQLGGQILLGKSATALTVKENRISQCNIDGQTYDIDELVWTGNPFALCQLLNIDSPRLEFLHSKFVYVFLRKCLKEHQTCYYADSNVSFVRGTILSNHSKDIIRNKNISDIVCLEYTHKSLEEMNANAENIKLSITAELKKVKLIDHDDDVESVFEIKAPYSYPILTTDYREKIAALQEQLSRFAGLISIGRQATFNYENSDVIIKNVLHHPMFHPDDAHHDAGKSSANNFMEKGDPQRCQDKMGKSLKS